MNNELNKSQNIMQKIERLKEEKCAVEKKLHELKCTMELAKETETRFGQRIMWLNGEIAAIKRDYEGVTMSDHAFVRYLERYLGVDINEVKHQLLSKFPPHVPDGNFTAEGVTFVIKQNNVVTILEQEMRTSKKMVRK